jgi:hypothetical protein
MSSAALFAVLNWASGGISGREGYPPRELARLQSGACLECVNFGSLGSVMNWVALAGLRSID